MKTKRGLKIFIIAVAVALVAIGLLFGLWFIMPYSELYIAILDKTVPATAADGHSYLENVDNIYRKHLGFNWMLNHLKIRNPDTGDRYSEVNDYYGYLLNTAYELLPDERLLEDMDEIPDLLYLSDTYGTELTEDKGITGAEMNMISMCNYAGSVVIGEQDILITATESAVAEQLQELFGIDETGWVGRYIYDLADLTDVPYWAPPMYKEKYGVEWRCSGSGILLVSGSGDILVFEAKKDFETDSLLKIRTVKEYQKEFGKRSVNYYSWFELIKAVGATETLAEYEFNFNSTGMEKFAPVSDTPVFAAVTRARRSENSAPVYYFAGDFGDYVDDMNIACFFLADRFFRAVSVDRDGDVTHFFWHFYEPLMAKILKDVKNNASVHHATEEEKNKPDEETAKFIGHSLSIRTENGWQPFDSKAFNLRAEEPGCGIGEYSDNYDYYRRLFEFMRNMGTGAVRAYDLYPPEFYRTLYEHNVDHADTPVYLCQSVTLSGNTTVEDLFSQEGRDAVQNRISQIVEAIHGNIKLSGDGGSQRYLNNVAGVTVCYIIDPGLTEAEWRTLAQNASAEYEGSFLSASGNGAEALLAMMGDMLLRYCRETYGTLPVVFLKGETAMLSGASWQENNSVTFNPSAVAVADSAKEKVGAAFSAMYSDVPYQALKTTSVPSADASAVYGAYLDQILTRSVLPVLIDALGASTCVNVFDRETDIYGLSEEQQAAQILRMHQCVRERDFAGAVIADLNDTWSVVGSDASAYTVPPSSTGLWHDVTDPQQTMGVLSVDAIMPTAIGLDLAQDNERMSDMQLMRNESYLYVTVSLNSEVDFEKEQMFIGFDTYQRNNGEYYYDTKFFGNALSGMEFIVKFESKSAASLYCVPSYNRSKARLSSVESYTAVYELVAPLRYGSFATQNTQFFQTGNTVHLRVPWAMLNISDPSQLIVLNDTTAVLNDAEDTYETTLTTGAIVSVFIGDIESKDTNYVFPSDKQSPGFKRYEWAAWKKENVTYGIAEKSAVETLRKYFAAY